MFCIYSIQLLLTHDPSHDGGPTECCSIVAWNESECLARERASVARTLIPRYRVCNARPYYACILSKLLAEPLLLACHLAGGARARSWAAAAWLLRALLSRESAVVLLPPPCLFGSWYATSGKVDTWCRSSSGRARRCWFHSYQQGSQQQQRSGAMGAGGPCATGPALQAE
jgi:hypothetical protein